MEQERELLKTMIDQAFENGYPLFSCEIVKQSEAMDQYIVEHMKEGGYIG